MGPMLEGPPRRSSARWLPTGTDVPGYVSEGPGMSAFVLSDGTVYHTYSTGGRGSSS